MYPKLEFITASYLHKTISHAIVLHVNNELSLKSRSDSYSKTKKEQKLIDDT
jgi:hypothetical protein